MIVADGSILTADDKENTDLFWAVRGGGCNFGVCAEFVFKLYEQRRTVYSGMMIFPPPLLNPLLKGTQEWWEKGPSAKEGMIQIVTRGPPPECNVRDAHQSSKFTLLTLYLSHVLLFSPFIMVPKRKAEKYLSFSSISVSQIEA